MAQQLCTGGEEVRFLALFDASAPNYRARRSLAKRHTSSLSLREIFLARVGRHFSVLSQLSPWKGATYIGTKIDVYGRGKSFFNIVIKRIKTWVCLAYVVFHRPLPSWLFRFFLIEVFESQALRNYVPKVYPGKLTLFRVKNSRHDSDFGWEGLIRGGLDIQEILGTHSDFMKPPHVEVFANKLEACLNQNIPDTHPISRRRNTH